MPTKTYRSRASVRAKRRNRLLWIGALGAVALGLILFFVLRGLPGAPSWDATSPLAVGDLVAGRYRLGAAQSAIRERPSAQSDQDGVQTWTLDGAALRFAGNPPRLLGAQLDSAAWAGPRSMRVGDPLEKLYKALPVANYDEQPEDYVLLYAKATQGDLPVAPYAALIPAGSALRVHTVAPLEGGGFTICDFDANPDTNLIERITWETAADDPLLNELR